MPGADKQTESRQDDSAKISILQRIFTSGASGTIQTAGLVFTIAAALAFFYAILYMITVGAQTKAVTTSQDVNVWRDIISPNFNVIGVTTIGLVCALLSLRLFSKAGALASQVIRQEDRDLLTPLISSANRNAINEYIKLASLTGFSGNFTKLGFTGLPLITVALTLILILITLSLADGELQKSVFDLAKLTLGAFLGSFVQRNIEQEKLAGSVAGAGEAGGLGKPNVIAAIKPHEQVPGQSNTPAENQSTTQAGDKPVG